MARDGNVKKFIDGRDSGKDGVQRYDDLRFEPAKKSTTANTRQMRSKDQAEDKPAKTQSNLQVQHGHPQPSRDQNGRRPFHGTDYSGTSTTPSITQRDTDIAGGLHQQPPGDDSGGSDPSSQVAAGHEYEDQAEDEGGSEAGSEEDLPADPLQSRSLVTLSQKQRRLMEEMHPSTQEPAGSSSPRVRGDTYPSTTSGHPSVTESEYGGKHHGTPAVVTAALPSRESFAGHQYGNGVLPKRQAPALGQQQQDAVHSGFLSRPNAEHQNPTEQVASGFSFAKPAAVAPNHMGHGQARQRVVASPTTVKPVISNNTTQRASVPSADQVPQQEARKQQHAVPSARDHVQQQTRKQQHAVPLVEDRKASPLQQQRPVARQRSNDRPHVQLQAEPGESEYEHRTDAEADLKADVKNCTRQQLHHEELDTELDFDPPQLFDMEYADLKSQSFDVDPNPTESGLPANQQDEPLDTKLPIIAALPSQDQADFFSALSIDDWDQAGEWFLGRFGDVFSKLKDARQEKRKAAKLFEDEIEQRHAAVTKKRKQAEAALGDMKESGGKVLEGTPKKARKA